MPANLDSLLRAIAADPGLQAGTSTAQYNGGVAAAKLLDSVLLQMIDATNVNDDGMLSAADMKKVSDTLWTDNFSTPWRQFFVGHGNDNGTLETGYHLLQNDGGTLQFQGRNLINTVIDAIFHYGFEVTDGRYVNEDGAANETTTDVAGWLNYFLNGENVIYGNATIADEVGSGEYSNVFAAARNETFMMGTGNDKVWADIGNDKVFAGAGADKVGAGLGADRVFGQAGNDTIWGEKGADALYGGNGKDVIGGGEDNDHLYGGDMNDTVYGEDGNDLVDGGAQGDALDGQGGADTLYGGQGHDKMGGGDGMDRLIGGADNDSMSGGEGMDTLRGGTGADDLVLWENTKARDTIIFAMGDSGKTVDTMDEVIGFQSGSDKIDLTAFGKMTFQPLDFSAGGKASCYFDGHYLRIDADGNGTNDMMVAFDGMGEMRASDFIFA
jgi:Ca2+-binding RTX toxin-like protein